MLEKPGIMLAEIQDEVFKLYNEELALFIICKLLHMQSKFFQAKNANLSKAEG